MQKCIIQDESIYRHHKANDRGLFLADHVLHLKVYGLMVPDPENYLCHQ